MTTEIAEPPRRASLMKIASGTWLRCESIGSVVAFGTQEKPPRKARVCIDSGTERLTWDFETTEEAVAFADKVGEAVNASAIAAAETQP